MSTESSSTINLTVNIPGLGNLGKFPRELRDEIYRYLVQDRYWFIQAPLDSCVHMETGVGSRLVLRRESHCPNVAICQVSKATHDEFTSILYAESVYCYSVHIIFRDRWTILRPVPALNRAMNIEIDFDCLAWPDVSNDTKTDIYEYNLTGLLDVLTGPGSLRNMLIVKLSRHPLQKNMTLHVQIVRRLKALVNFRTVIVNIRPFLNCDSEKYTLEKTEPLIRAMKVEMVPTMGPASLRHVGRTTYLEFHPLDYMQENLIDHAEETNGKENMQEVAGGLEACY